MNQNPYVATRTATSGVVINKVLRNTYLLLSMTLLFSALTAGVAMVTGAHLVHPLVLLAVFWGMPMLIFRMRNSAWSLPLTFVFTGAMGYFLGPILSIYLSLPNGASNVMMAMGTTGLAFIGLSGYALVSRRDFSFMGGFLMVGLIVAIVAMVAGFFFSMPGYQLAVSSLVVMLMAGLILFDTSRIVHGGETNYVVATVSLYSNIYVLLSHLLFLFSDD